MLGPIRSHVTYANVMATVAVFIALGGTSYAALVVTSKNIKNNTVKSADIKNNSITGTDIRTGAVDEDDIKDGSISVRDFKPSEVYKGPAGPAGPRGLAGPFGPTGPLGPTGLTGARGETGAKGETGDRGPAGAKGETGSAGPTGAIGPAGSKGDAGPAGPTGAIGPAGPKGATGPAGPAGAGALVRDGNNVTLGRVLSADWMDVTVLTSTGYIVAIPWTGVFRPAQIYYTGANCSGTAFLNDGGIGVAPTSEDAAISGKWLVYSGSQNTLMRPATVVNGVSDNEEFTAATIDNPGCDGSAGQRSGWKLTPITRAAAGLPATIAPPITVVATG